MMNAPFGLPPPTPTFRWRNAVILAATVVVLLIVVGVLNYQAEAPRRAYDKCMASSTAHGPVVDDADCQTLLRG